MSDAATTPAELFADIVPDGRCLPFNRDPPGQSSVYIPPGEPESETYRLSTFKNFSQTIPINPCRFASSGFYYTGYGDRVKCFSCGQAADSWLIGDDVTLKQWHKRDCDFINGKETGNVPIGSIFGRRPRVDTGASSSQPGNISVPQPRVNGIGNMTAAASNASRRNSLPNAAIAFPAQSSAATNTNRFETPSTRRHYASHLTEQERRNLKAMFPCENPINPHMREADSRLQTFLDNPGTWPASRVRATPQEIVDAGMYYLGERDRVKCWYCNGGLQNWDRDDNPWEEHAKWFPMCEYVLQQKGPTFVHDIVARFPNLRRPVLYNPSTASATNQLREVQSGPRFSGYGANRVNGAPEIIDPRKKMREWRLKTDEAMRSSEIVFQAKEMGFEDAAIREVIMRKYEASNQNFSTFESLVEALVSLPEEDIPSGSNEEEIATSENQSPPLFTSELSSTSGLEEMQRLEESRLCKMCKSEPSCVVFIPCGHLSTCLDCSKKVSKCPVCKTVIQEKVRSYLS